MSLKELEPLVAESFSLRVQMKLKLGQAADFLFIYLYPYRMDSWGILTPDSSMTGAVRFLTVHNHLQVSLASPDDVRGSR